MVAIMAPLAWRPISPVSRMIWGGEVANVWVQAQGLHQKTPRSAHRQEAKPPRQSGGATVKSPPPHLLPCNGHLQALCRGDRV
jgi:hypothetical protein